MRVCMCNEVATQQLLFLLDEAHSICQKFFHVVLDESVARENKGGTTRESGPSISYHIARTLRLDVIEWKLVYHRAERMARTVRLLVS